MVLALDPMHVQGAYGRTGEFQPRSLCVYLVLANGVGIALNKANDHVWVLHWAADGEQVDIRAGGLDKNYDVEKNGAGVVVALINNEDPDERWERFALDQPFQDVVRGRFVAHLDAGDAE